MSFQVGDKVGDYTLVGLVGAGAVGRVFKVEHAVTKRVEAMKVLLESQAQTSEQEQRFQREIHVQASLNHPNIASVHNAFWADGCLVMIMELVEGTSLDQWMDGPRLSMRECVDFCRQMLAALSYAHSRCVTHRDIKPANMIVTPEGVVKLTDFGLAKTLTDPSLTQSGALLGSVSYMAPEQVRGLDVVDARTDVYSCGVVLYELVTGLKPFDTQNVFAMMWAHVEDVPKPPETLNPDVPLSLSAIILKALAKDPRSRFRSASEFLQALDTVKDEMDRGGEQKYRAPIRLRMAANPPAASKEAALTAKGDAIQALDSIAAVARTLQGSSRNRRLALAMPILAAACALLIWTTVVSQEHADVPGKAPQAARTEGGAGMSSGDERQAVSMSAQNSGPTPVETPAEPKTAKAADEGSPSGPWANLLPRNPENRQGGTVPSPEPASAIPLRKSQAQTAGREPAEALARAPQVEQRSDLLRRLLVIPVGNPIYSIALSSDGRWIAVGMPGRSIRIHDTTTGAVVASLQGHTDRVVALSFNKDHSLLASGSWDGTAKVWKIDQLHDIKTFGLKGYVTAVALSDDGDWLAAGSTEENLQLWDLREQAQGRELKGHKRGVQTLAFSPDSKSLASVALDKHIFIWPVGREDQPRELSGPPNGASALLFSPNGRLLASAGSGLLKVWDVRSGSEEKTTQTPGWIYSLAFESGSWLSASARSESPQTIQVWQDSRNLGSVDHSGTVRLLSWSRNGERLATAGEDGRVSIWEVAGGAMASALASRF